MGLVLARGTFNSTGDWSGVGSPTVVCVHAPRLDSQSTVGSDSSNKIIENLTVAMHVVESGRGEYAWDGVGGSGLSLGPDRR